MDKFVFDRELTLASIFDVRDEIAQTIGDALHGTLSAPVAKGPVPKQNMTAYRAYHEAIIVRDAMHSRITSEAYRDLLQKAATLDPEFIRPKTLLVGSYDLSAFDGDLEPVTKVEEYLEQNEAAARGTADFLIAQTYYTYYVIEDYALADELSTRELTPSDA